MTTAQQHALDPEQFEAQSTGKLMQALLIAAIAASGISMIFSVGTAVAAASDQPAPASVAAEAD